MFDWVLDHPTLAVLYLLAVIGGFVWSRVRRDPLGLTVASSGGLALALFALGWAGSISREAAVATFLAGMGTIVMTQAR